MSDRAATTTARDSAGVPVPPPLIYVAGFLVGVAIELVLPVGGPPRAVTIAVAMVAGAQRLALDGSAMARSRAPAPAWFQCGRASRSSSKGPYRFTRNPMYVGMACLYVGLAVALGVIWALALLPVVIVAVDRLVIAREERYLERRFGHAYQDYKRRARRWL